MSKESVKYNIIIRELINAWYEYVSLDAHKDRDCSFFIETTHEYRPNGQRAVTYRIIHYGYVAGSHERRIFETDFPQFEDAQKALISMITDMMSYRVSLDSDEYESQRKYAKKVFRKLVDKYGGIDYV